MSGASDHAIAMPLAWHGRLMVLAMGLLTPPLIIVARFFKVTPQQDWPRHLDNPFWFITHRHWGHIVGAIVEPDMQISRIRLSDKTSRICFCVRRHRQFLNTFRS